MANYLIEFRFSGYAKKYLKQTIFEVSKKFKVKGALNKHVVPHITMFGPFNTNNEWKVVSTFHKICKKHTLIPFELKGFGNFHNRVIFVEIIPSNELKLFRKELSKELTNMRDFFIFKTIKTKGVSDYEEHYPFHATIAFKDIQSKFNSIFNYLRSRKNPHIYQKLLRLTLLRDGKILYEYDFIQRRLLNRRDALNKLVWRKTISRLKNE